MPNVTAPCSLSEVTTNTHRTSVTSVTAVNALSNYSKKLKLSIIKDRSMMVLEYYHTKVKLIHKTYYHYLIKCMVMDIIMLVVTST